MKECQKCKSIKPLEEFHKDRTKPDGHVGTCKPCKKEYRHSYYLENSDRLIKYSWEFEKSNRVSSNITRKKWREANRDRLLASRRSRHKNRYDNDPAYACQVKVRSMVGRVLKAAGKPKNFITFQKIGYTTEQLMQRLSVNFKNGMSWENFGEWEIDHKIPIAMMVARGETRPDVINCLANLQPLWKAENRSKGARYVG